MRGDLLQPTARTNRERIERSLNTEILQEGYNTFGNTGAQRDKTYEFSYPFDHRHKFNNWAG
jgi:hypothetical protein